jgi:hypothetical protein
MKRLVDATLFVALARFAASTWETSLPMPG